MAPVPNATFLVCNPAVRGVAEEMELRFFREQIAEVARLIAQTNAQLGSAVRIGAVLVDSERFYISEAALLPALARKHDLIFNMSLEHCPPPHCTIEQYNRSTIERDETLAKESSADGWVPWPGYPGCMGRGDTFGTSLYSIPEPGLTREAFRRTVANAAKCGIAHVTPWLWLGGGNYRTVSATSTGIRDDFTWDYNLACASVLRRACAD